MLEEQGRVVEVQAGFVWVETQRRSTCGACNLNGGCGTSVLSRVMGQRRTRVRALDSLGARVGEEVVIGIEDTMLLRGSLAVYAVPLVGLLAGAMLGAALAPRLGFAAESGSILLGLAGLGAGILWLTYYARRTRLDRRYQPVVLRRTGTLIFSN